MWVVSEDEGAWVNAATEGTMGQAVATGAVEPARRTADRRAVSERRLFCRYRDQGDEAAREEIVERFLPLAERLARRYRWGREPVEDLVQVACLGLVKAVDRFDHERGVAFSTYAVPTIMGELKRHLRDTTWSVHVSQQMRQRVLEVTGAADQLRGRIGRSPTVEEIAEALDMPVACVVEAVEAATAYDAASLDHLGDPDRSPDGRNPALGFEDDRFELIEYGAILQPAIGALPGRERLILRLRFDRDMTQGEIAKALGMSQMHVSRLLRRSLAKLRQVASARTALA
jgi:RNA polymerase sigma-B factor